LIRKLQEGTIDQQKLSVKIAFSYTSCSFPLLATYLLQYDHFPQTTTPHHTHLTMSDLPKTMKAIKVVEPGKPEIQEVPLPKMRDDYILVKVKAVALNP
jgi:hypothetical protein